MNIPYASLFADAGKKYGVDPALLAAVAKAESGFNPNAVSPAGALGLMQLMPETAASLGVNPMNPMQAVDAAARIFRQNLQRFGSVALAAAAYNAGPGAVVQYGGVPPYAETQNYVREVLEYQSQFESSFGTGMNWKTAAAVGGVVAVAGAAVWWLKTRFLR
jgi:soluble lytic murein transglycosylase-like protein